MSLLLLDVNVVLAAHRGDHPHHDVVRPWFDAAVRGADGFCVPLTVCASFLRLSTSRRIFTVPATVDEAFVFLTATRQQPGHLPLEPGPRHLPLLRRASTSTDQHRPVRTQHTEHHPAHRAPGTAARPSPLCAQLSARTHTHTTSAPAGKENSRGRRHRHHRGRQPHR